MQKKGNKQYITHHHHLKNCSILHNFIDTFAISHTIPQTSQISTSNLNN